MFGKECTDTVMFCKVLHLLPRGNDFLSTYSTCIVVGKHNRFDRAVNDKTYNNQGVTKRCHITQANLNFCIKYKVYINILYIYKVKKYRCMN